MKKDIEHQPWLFIAMLIAFVVFLAFTLPSHADTIVVCSPCIPKATVASSDLVMVGPESQGSGPYDFVAKPLPSSMYGFLPPDALVATCSNNATDLKLCIMTLTRRRNLPDPNSPPVATSNPPIPAADVIAICTPAPPRNSVTTVYQSCGIVNGIATTSWAFHVVKTTVLDSVVYRQVLNAAGGPGDVVAIVAGSAPADTECDATQTFSTKGVTYYRIDKRVVTFSGNQKPAVVWAKCPG
jgi:hypothetical protein